MYVSCVPLLYVTHQNPCFFAVHDVRKTEQQARAVMQWAQLSQRG
jgi:hypothetical protein